MKRKPRLTRNERKFNQYLDSVEQRYVPASVDIRKVRKQLDDFVSRGIDLLHGDMLVVSDGHGTHRFDMETHHIHYNNRTFPGVQVQWMTNNERGQAALAQKQLVLPAGCGVNKAHIPTAHDHVKAIIDESLVRSHVFQAASGDWAIPSWALRKAVP